MVHGTLRRRARQSEAQPRVVQSSLANEEFQEVSRAPERSGLVRGAFAAEATLAMARDAEPRMSSLLREALVELMAAAGLVRGAGTNLNQAVAKLNATGQLPGELVPCAQVCMRRAEHLDAVAEQLRKTLR